MDAAQRKKFHKMGSTFDLTGFYGYLLFVENGKGQLRQHFEANMQFRGEQEPIIIVPPSDYPVGLLYWDTDINLFRVVTVRPEEAHYR